MKIAVTGLTGFLGYYVAKRLFEKNIQIQALIRNNSNTRHLLDYQKNITFVKGDLTDKKTLEKFIQGADVVIHMAYEHNGATFHEADGRDIKRFLESNLSGSVELLDISKQANIRQFIFISSCAVYGHIIPHSKLDEFHPLMPDSNHGAYKASVEAFCHAYFLSKAFNITIFRPVGIYGIHPHLESSTWYHIVRNIKHGCNVEVSGGGKVVYVDDVAQAISLAIGNEEASCKIYNLVDFYIDTISVAHIAKKLCDSQSTISGTPKYPVHTIDTTQSRALGIHYAGIEGLKRYIQEIINRI